MTKVWDLSKIYLLLSGVQRSYLAVTSALLSAAKYAHRVNIAKFAVGQISLRILSI